MKIDYNTANIIFPLNTPNGEIQVYVPPVSSSEAKANALVLGRFVEVFDTVNMVVLVSDYEIYIDEIIESLANSKYSNETDRVKFINEKKNSLLAMLERSISGAYFFDDAKKELKGVNDLEDEAKDMVRAMLLVFTVFFRYFKRNVSEEVWTERMNELGISFTSLNATEWKNTLKTASSKEETLGL